MGISVTKLLIVLAIIIVIFGTKRLKNVGGDLGAAIKSFRNAVKDEDAATKSDDSEKSINSETTANKNDNS
jgi:sec-independent protein translocase protein TatA